eukprot:GHVN01009612.1.p1 GENE.GHVN01009612.1~~GHVN01009612.1.p1  ORF type:complete len:137 (+),score=11.31 GHVN01009612.1:350-760(+)
MHSIRGESLHRSLECSMKRQIQFNASHNLIDTNIWISLFGPHYERLEQEFSRLATNQKVGKEKPEWMDQAHRMKSTFKAPSAIVIKKAEYLPPGLGDQYVYQAEYDTQPFMETVNPLNSDFRSQESTEGGRKKVLE